MRKLANTIFLIMIFALASSSIGHSAPPAWTPISTNQYNIVAYGDVYISGNKISNTDYSLGAFGPGGESDCRAAGNVEGNGSYYLTVRGDTDGDTISFKVYNSSNDQIYDVEETVVFQSDDTKVLDLTVITALTISGEPNTTAKRNTAYQFIPTVKGINAGDTLTFSITNKPSWINFDTSTGTLTGTPTDADTGTTSDIIITVTNNSNGDSTSLGPFSIAAKKEDNKTKSSSSKGGCFISILRLN